MFYDSFDYWWWPYAFITLAGVLPTAIWRWAGVFAIGNIDETSQWLTLVRCIATALVAAVISQLVFFPTGALEQVPLWLRASAALGGFGAFLFANNRLLVCMLVGQTILLGGILAIS
ncbi:MAG: AzlD domain-containing protein [Ahrensia sp.]|nr:AzlD domain-containing protein [Ahrensia sp.]